METSFTLKMPDGAERLMGSGEPKFEIVLNNNRAVKAMGSLDEGNIGEAYLQGDFDINGNLLEMFSLRGSMDDKHPMVTAWRFIQPLLFGQVYTNRQAISSHYDVDPKMFLSFLDKKFPAYTQGVYESDDETLSTATERKFIYTSDLLELGPRKRVLEIGTGSGYNAALLAELTGEVVTVERHLQLVKSARENLKQAGYKEVIVVNGDGKNGYISQAPYDRIMVTAAAHKVPQQLKDQLSIGGLLVAPIGATYGCEMLTLKKISSENFQTRNHGLFSFVPLV